MRERERDLREACRVPPLFCSIYSFPMYVKLRTSTSTALKLTRAHRRAKLALQRRELE